MTIAIFVYGVGVLIFLCVWSAERACGMLVEGRLFVVVASLIWPVMMLHVVPFGIKQFFDGENWK